MTVRSDRELPRTHRFHSVGEDLFATWTNPDHVSCFVILFLDKVDRDESL